MKKISRPKTLGLISFAFILISVFWLWTTVLPVVGVEIGYRYQKFLDETLHISSLTELFVADFSGLNVREKSKYRDYGIKIPAVYIDEPVVFNVDPNDEKAYSEALKKGIAHASSTTFPDNGGLGYYFAHSSSPELRTQYNAIFYLLGKLEKEDEIYIWHEGKKNEYRVVETKIVAPNEVDFLYQDYDQETIVLQTCWPPGTTKNRLLVFAERVEE